MKENDWIHQRIGPYLVQQYVAGGAMADVFLAFDTALQRRVCLKLMRASYLDEPVLQTRFQREAQTIARLEQHTGVVRVFDTGVTPQTNQPYIVMEYAENGSLEKMVDTYRRRGVPLSPVTVLTIARQVAATLIDVHAQKVVHRDLKPANILLRGDGRPLLADFGIVSVQEATRLTETGHVLGTLAYMAPEQLADSRRVDGRADIYALGVILYELLAGRLPFAPPDPWRLADYTPSDEPPPLAQWRPDLTATTCRLIHTCLRLNPADRYQSAAELVVACDEALAAERGHTPALAARQHPAWLWARQNWWLLAPLLLVLLVLPFSLLALFAPPPLPPVAAVSPEPPPTESLPPPLILPAVDLLLAPATPTPTFIPRTATPTLTWTPTPSATPSPLATPVDTGGDATGEALNTPILPLVITLPATPALAIEVCFHEPAGRWLAIYEQHAARLACPHRAAVELPFEQAAYQRYLGGLAIWRGDVERVYLLYQDGSYAEFDVTAAHQEYGSTDTLKGAFGWVWHTFAAARNRLGTPSEAEANVRDFVVQDFSGGVIFYFAGNDGRTYLLFTDSHTWTAQP